MHLLAGTAILVGLLTLARSRKPAPTLQPVATPDDRLRAPSATPLALPRATASARVSPSGEQDADTEDMAAAAGRQVVAKSRAAYAACTTYEDEGTLDTAFRGEHQFLEQVAFHTVFAGPNAVRVAYRRLPGEFNDEQLTQVIVDDAGAESVGPWDTKPRRLENLEHAVASFAGVSNGLTADILPLLPAGLKGIHTWLDVPTPELAGTEDVDGETCDVLEATDRGMHLRISIGQSDSLIRRVSRDLVLSVDAVRSMHTTAAALVRDAGLTLEDDSDREAGGLSTFTITTFHPRCGRPIGVDALRLTDGSL